MVASKNKNASSALPAPRQDVYGDEENPCNRLLQVILLALSVAAILFGFAAVYNCEFLMFNVPTGTLPPTTENGLTVILANETTGATTSPWTPNLEKIENEREVTWGLFRYQDSLQSNVCYRYSDPDGPFPMTDISWQFNVARWAASISAVLGCVALFVLAVEICCCRFPCSRVFVNMGFMLSSMAIPPVFLVYTEGSCNIFSDTSYSCELGTGAIQIFVAFACFVMAFAVSCATPKSKPLIRMIQAREQRSVQDPCCGMKGKSKEEILEGNPDLLEDNKYVDTNSASHHTAIPVGSGDAVMVQAGAKSRTSYFGGKKENHMGATAASTTTATGETYFFKHYMDDQAGATLQSQYKAASRRWLECEQNYETVLDRFKQECEDATMAEKEDFAYPNAENSTYEWRKILLLPTRSIGDPELKRLVGVLKTLQRSSQQAKQVMEQIEMDLQEHIKIKTEKDDVNMSAVWKSDPRQRRALASRAPIAKAQNSGDTPQEREVLLPNNNGSVRGSKLNASSLNMDDLASAEMSIHSEQSDEQGPILDTVSEPGPRAHEATVADHFRRPFGWLPFEIKKKEK